MPKLDTDSMHGRYASKCPRLNKLRSSELHIPKESNYYAYPMAVATMQVVQLERVPARARAQREYGHQHAHLCMLQAIARHRICRMFSHSTRSCLQARIRAAGTAK
eukprot:4274723-Pleurochrysis_carterae.AAC.1